MTNIERYQEELADHAEEAGSDVPLGTKEELRSAFTLYRQSVIKRKFPYLVGIFFLILALTSLAYLGADDNTDHIILALLSPALYMPVVIIGMFLMMPITFIYIGASSLITMVFPDFHADFLLPIFPLLSALFWTSILTTLTLSPKDIKHLLSKNI
jgi:hypothetical protein